MKTNEELDDNIVRVEWILICGIVLILFTILMSLTAVVDKIERVENAINVVK